MSDSDTSSEENYDLLREAADAQFINDSMFALCGNGNKAKEQNCTSEKQRPVSLRPRLDEDRQYNHLGLHVTPEFQSFVAKHLDKIIDKQLVEYTNEPPPSLVQNGDKRAQGGVRLFHHSSNYLLAELTPSYRMQKRKILQEEDADVLEKCKMVAISPEWVLSGKGTQGWIKPVRGEVLVVNTAGEVIEHTGAKKKMKSNSWGVRDDTFHIDARTLEQKEKQKKKRMKLKEKKKLKKATNEVLKSES